MIIIIKVILCNLLFNLLIMFYLLLKEKNLTNYKKYKKNRILLNLTVDLSLNLFFFFTSILIFKLPNENTKPLSNFPTFHFSFF